jgi:hypothetical protein
MDPFHQFPMPRFQISGAEFIVQPKNIPRLFHRIGRPGSSPPWIVVLFLFRRSRREPQRPEHKPDDRQDKGDSQPKPLNNPVRKFVSGRRRPYPGINCQVNPQIPQDSRRDPDGMISA